MIFEPTFGQFFFSQMNHSLYDLLIYRFVVPKIWGCNTDAVVDNYQRNLSDNHLEIGVGTGYLLRQVEPNPRYLKLSLMDLNKPCLDKSAKRLHAYSPNTYHQDIMLPLKVNGKHFASIGLNFVMHCVPGSYKEKNIAFKHIYEALKDNGVFFGATVLTDSHDKTIAARLTMALLNSLGIFYNSDDRLEEFKNSLESLFDLVEIQIVGSTVLWRAQKHSGLKHEQ